MYQKLKTKLKASMLVVTLMIMGIILVSTLSIALVAVQERKASIGQNTSSQAYTTAENGIEIVMQLMKNNEGGKLSSITGCANGVVTSTEGYTVKFKDADDEFIIDCGAEIASVKTVKSIGTVGQNQRAVEVAVAADDCHNGRKLILSSNTSYFDYDDYVFLRDYQADVNNGSISGSYCKFSNDVVQYAVVTGIQLAPNSKNMSLLGMYTVGCDWNAGRFYCSGSGVQCTGGWQVYASCTCPLGSC